LASCGYDCTVRIWDISNSFEFDKEARKYEGIFPLLTLAELDENTVAFGGDDCLITVWDWRKDMIMHKCYAHLGSTTSLTVCFPNLLYSIGGDCKIKVWKYG
jgi:WD40 repeat protein